MTTSANESTRTSDADARVPRRRWLVPLLVMATTAVAYLDRINLSVAAPVLTREFGVSAAVMGLLLSSFSWTYTLLNVPAGLLVDRLRTRVVYSAALVVWALAGFGAALVSSIGALFGPRLLLGVGEAPFIPASVRTLSDWLPRAERGAGTGLLVSGIALGSAVGPLLLAPLVTTLGWRSCFVATGVLSLLVAALWFGWYRHPRDDRRLAEPERELIVAGQEEAPARAPWRRVARHRDVWVLALGYFCLLYILYTFVTWVPSYLVADRHLTVLRSGLLSAVPWAVAFVLTLLVAPVSDLALRRGVPPLRARKIALTAGMLAALAILGTAFSPSAGVAIACLSVSVSGILLANGGVLAATQDVARVLDLPGSAAGIINTVGNVGGLAGPIVTGALVTATHSFAAPLVVAAGLALVGALTWLFGLRTRAPAVPA
jgi:MFS transporter, ACS family, D-galactonate transporter